uniref:Uncharacterized protein n=2 Tax=gambiae species complex TaxID=44542 RepID=A0A182I4C3_ANOAR
MFLPGNAVPESAGKLVPTRYGTMALRQLLMCTELRICTACGEPIADKYLFDIDGCAWHGSCLRCSVCLTLLERQPSCYFRDRQVYCRTDYIK